MTIIEPNTQFVGAWQDYAKLIQGDWQSFTTRTAPKATMCGPVYEPFGSGNPLDRPNESFAIADMRGVKFAQPHRHTNGEQELYVAIHGNGLVVVGGEVHNITKGGAILTPSDTAHYVIPHEQNGLVLIVINTPPFNPNNSVTLTADHHGRFGYDHQRFLRLTSKL